MKKGFLILFVVLLLICRFTNAQVPNSQVLNSSLKIIPPSPDAASLGSYGNNSVGYYSGSVSVDVPIYDIKTPDHQLSLKLQYSSTGFRVAEDAGWAGLGWNFQAGGVISRVVRGKDDFYGFYSAPALPSSDASNNYNGTLTSDLTRFQSILEGQDDGEPDIFYYNFAGLSGKFILDKSTPTQTGGPVLVAQRNNLKFEVYQSSDPAYYWVVTDARGYKYYFKASETTEDFNAYQPGYFPSYNTLPTVYYNEIFNQLGNPSTHISSWYITKIESPSGDNIEFQYTSGTFVWGPVSVYEEQYVLNSLAASCSSGLSGIYSSYQLSRQKHWTKFLKKIIFRSGYIEINRFQNDVQEDAKIYRDDISPADQQLPQRLRRVEIFDNSGNLVKKFLLDYSYFLPSTSTDNPNKRLKLDKVTEFGSDATAKPAYVFQYHNPGSFPAKNSKAVDWWGYYNGQYDNQTFIPKIYHDGKSFKGANRLASTDINHVKYGVLTSVTYPTGGRSEFEYELNDYSNSINYMLDQEIISGSMSVTNQWNCTDWSNPNSCTWDLTPMIVEVTQEQYDAAEQNLVAAVWFDAENCSLDPSTYGPGQCQTYTCGGGCDLTTNNNNTAMAQLKYWSYSNSNMNNAATSSTNLAPTNNCGPDQNYGMVGHTFGVPVNLYPGFYKLTPMQPGISPYACGTTTLYWEFPRTTNSTMKNGGGLRIKKILNYDNVKTSPEIKKYLYTADGTATGTTSGLLLTVPHFLAFQTLANVKVFSGMVTQYCFSTGDYMLRTSSSLAQAGYTANGAIVGYSRVTELTGENGEGGKTEYEFMNTPDDMSEIPGVPNHSYTDNGLLLSTTFKKSDGTPVRKIANTYTSKEKYSVKGVKVINLNKDSDEYYGIYQYGVKYYDNESEWLALTSETTTDYYSTGNVVVTKDNFYENSTHKELTREEVIQSDGSTLIRKYKRPSDYTGYSLNTVLNSMVSKNIISPVIEQQTLIKRNGTTKLTGGELTKYKSISTTSGGTTYNPLVPDITYRLNLSAPSSTTTQSYLSSGALTMNSAYEAEITYDEYDQKGNLSRYHKQSGPNTSILYGYNGTLPVAEIVNANSSQVAYTSFEETTTGNDGWSIQGGTLTSKASGSSNVYAGNYSYKLNTGNPVYGPTINITPTVQSGKYKLSCWVKTESGYPSNGGFITIYSINGSSCCSGYPSNQPYLTTNISDTQGKWVYKEVVFDMDYVRQNGNIPAGTNLTLRAYVANTSTSKGYYVDELRLYPADAEMTTVTYTPLIGVTSIMDKTGAKVNSFEYDGHNRLRLVRDGSDNIVKSNNYHYKGNYIIRNSATNRENAITPAGASVEVIPGSNFTWLINTGATITINGLQVSTFPYTSPNGTTWNLTLYSAQYKELKASNIQGNETFSLTY
ncbi:MAG: hypothetical protein J7604_17585 [Sporocytophaga sp.]|uniref:hypothetical protein n=1 Tax=Sporocytophaga sp. TaxID=2231183 RepID=UPI001AFFD626|nr:hypothetical protein [Sporocytophaga sp.]MBO9702024.1 hypothetical protein [Sporocytophaga sp.]